MKTQDEFLKAIQQGEDDVLNVFLTQEPRDNSAIGQGILIALDIGKVDYFLKLINLYSGDLWYLSNDDGYTFFSRIPNAYRQINFENQNFDKVKTKKEQFTKKITEILSSTPELSDTPDKYGVTLRQYLLHSYTKTSTSPEIKALVQAQYPKDVVVKGQLIPDTEVASKLAQELGREVSEDEDVVEQFKIEKFIQDIKTTDDWKSYDDCKSYLSITLGEQEFDDFKTHIDALKGSRSTFVEFMGGLQLYLRTSELNKFIPDTFFGNEGSLKAVLDTIGLDVVESEDYVAKMSKAFQAFKTDSSGSKKPIGECINAFKANPETAYIFKLNDFFLKNGWTFQKRALEITRRLYLGAQHPSLTIDKCVEEANKYDELEHKTETIVKCFEEAKKYAELEQKLKTDLNLDILGSKGKAIQKAFHELMNEEADKGTLFANFKAQLISTYKTNTPQETEAFSAPAPKNISIFQRFWNLLKSVFVREQKSTLDNFFDSLNQNRNIFFQSKATKSKTLFEEKVLKDDSTQEREAKRAKPQ